MQAYEHQKKATKEAVLDLKNQGFHALFMEVGTGKSKVIIDTAKEVKPDKMIISAPKSLTGTWKEQLSIHADFPYSFLVYDSVRSKTRKWYEEFCFFQGSPFPILFVNTEAFQSMNSTLLYILDKFKSGSSVMLVIDESSDIKNPKAKRTINLSRLGHSVDYRMIATGTEIANSVLDLYSQFEFLSPGFWGFKSFFFFKNYFAILQERYLSGGRTFKEIVGFRKLDEIQSKIAPYTSRALKKDCLDLPEKIYANLPVEMTGESKKIYDDMKKDLMHIFENGDIVTVANKISLFTKFRQITGGTLAGRGIIDDKNAKLQALMGELSDSSEQAIIWSCFTEEISLLCKKIREICTISRFDGMVSDESRQEAIRLFTAGEARVFIANPAAASQGLNLQNCSLEYWYSLPTSAKVYEQAEGRIHRSGQKNVCVYKKITATGTVDERVSTLLDEKKDVMLSFREGNVKDILELIY